MTDGLLSLVQWLSPAFPTGAFAYSHGLEWSVAADEVRDAPGLSRWLTDILTRGAGGTDAVILAHALAPDADLDALAELARALAPSAERLEETEAQGAAFARTVAAVTGQTAPPRPLPVAVGAAAAGLGLDPVDVLALYLQAMAANLVTIAVRHVPLGQTEGQAVLAALLPLIRRLAAERATLPLSAIGSATIRADLAAMRHETMDVRIFKT